MTPEHLELLLEGRPSQQKRLLEALPERERRLRLHVLRSCTIEAIERPLQLAFALEGYELALSFGDYGVLEGGFDVEADLIWVWWRLEDLAPRLAHRPLSMSAEERGGLMEALEGRVDSILAEAAQSSRAPVFFSSFALPHASMGELAGLPGGPLDAVLRLNQRLRTLSTPSHHYLPLAETCAGMGRDLRMELYGNIPLPSTSWGLLALELTPIFLATARARRKVIAVDADNTLWGGVLGEDGPEACLCGVDYPGNVYLRIHWRLLELKASGMLLVLISKNDDALVKKAFETMPGLALALGDFVELRCNYEDKWSSLKAVAEKLDLGVDSFAFIDDSDFEREQMGQFLPEVLVLNDSSDPLEMLESLWNPELSELKQEQRDQHGQYVAQRERKELQGQSACREDFLKSLSLEVTWSPLNEALLPRAVQMLQKTNQFNLTTRRHGEAQLRQWMDEGQHLAMIKVGDRFGDQGWVGLVIALKGEELWEVDSLLLSCRVLGRGVEAVLWQRLLDDARAHGVEELVGTYIESPRNGLVKDLYARWGGTPVSSEGERRFFFKVADLSRPDLSHIEVKD